MTPQVALLLAVLLAGVPGGGARGGKAGKGAGGGVGGRYGYRGVTNAASYEVTWEDIVLAMQLSAMCFGALLMLCVVACCAYKICGPAEEVDWTNRYSVLKPVQPPRLPPEILREIYTLPATTSAPTTPRLTKPPTTTPPPTPAPDLKKGTGVVLCLEGGPRVTSVALDARGDIPGLAQLPNGRPGEPPLEDMVPPAPPRPATPRGSTRRSTRLSGLAAILEGRPCLPTLSSLAAARTARQQAGIGAANRLAAHHEDTSTLDLARAAASIPPYNYTHRTRYYPPTALV